MVCCAASEVLTVNVVHSEAYLNEERPHLLLRQRGLKRDNMQGVRASASVHKEEGGWWNLKACTTHPFAKFEKTAQISLLTIFHDDVERALKNGNSIGEAW